MSAIYPDSIDSLHYPWSLIGQTTEKSGRLKRAPFRKLDGAPSLSNGGRFESGRAPKIGVPPRGVPSLNGAGRARISPSPTPVFYCVVGHALAHVRECEIAFEMKRRGEKDRDEFKDRGHDKSPRSHACQKQKHAT